MIFVYGAMIYALSVVCWFWLAKNSGSNNQILLNGLYWDSVVMACYLTIPILFFNVTLALTQILGAAMIVGGVFLTKL